MRTVTQIFKEDQADRKKLDLSGGFEGLTKVSERDKERQKEVEILLKNKLIKTGADFYKAAMIYHHSPSYKNKGASKDHQTALKLAEQSVTKNYKKAKWLFAAITDRILIDQNKPQKFGTQYTKKDNNNPWILRPSDPKTTDAERKKYNVPTLKQMEQRIKKLNCK